MPAEKSAYAVADRTLNLGKRATGDDAARVRGAAFFVVKDWNEAVRAFGSIRHPDARDWNDLAAAQLCLARDRPQADPWLAALVSVDRALAIDPSLAAARFNRARILGALGALHPAQAEWNRYLRLDSSAPWASIARQGAEPLPPSERSAWRAATEHLDRLNPEQLAQLTGRFPEVARRFAEGAYLAAWAEAVKRRDAAAAGRLYDSILLIAQTLQRETGESLLADTLARIDRHDPPPLLLEGLIAYRDGRRAYSTFDFQGGEQRLRLAERLLRASGSPLAEMARFYVATAIGDQGHTEEAVQLLTAMRRDESCAYRALTSHVEYHLALLEAVLGHWSESLSHAKASIAGFSALRESNNAAIAQAVLSEDYDLIGQRELALNEGRQALRVTSAVGDIEFARVSLAVLCRTALRAGDAAAARSLTLIEEELERLEKIPRLDPDMFLRRAIAEWHLGSGGEAASIARARQAATLFNDVALRSKLLADIDATEGTFLRRRDPARAIALLTRAIEFQHRITRAFILPELHLQRGRAHLASGDIARAASDFDTGIAELERQRTHVTDAELRPGIFDSAAELFDEAIALELGPGADMEKVFAYVERGRARAVLEQLNAHDAVEAPTAATIADTQRNLDPGSVLVEYASLPDRLIAFVIRRESSALLTIRISRDALRAAAEALTERGGKDGSALHETLVAPLQSELRDAVAIHFVGDDILQRVPFAALFDVRSREFLIEKYVVATAPSAGVYLATRARARKFFDRPPATALVFGNPTIPRDEFGDLASLIASEYEAANVARQYPRADVFVRDAATAARFTEMAPRFDVVYFAGHGVENEREPYASALVCAATASRKGALTSRDIARMRFDSTRVVVLAACGTMKGHDAAIEGTPSISRAFIVAGVPSVVGTLWDVDDDQALAIVRPLHEQLARGVRPGVALQRAQLAAIRERVPTSLWSAFALMGSN